MPSQVHKNAHPTDKDTKYMTPAELRKELGIGKTTYYRWMRQNKLPPAAYFSPVVIRFPREEFYEWAKTHLISNAHHLSEP